MAHSMFNVLCAAAYIGVTCWAAVSPTASPSLTPTKLPTSKPSPAPATTLTTTPTTTLTTTPTTTLTTTPTTTEYVRTPASDPAVEPAIVVLATVSAVGAVGIIVIHVAVYYTNAARH